MNKIIFIIGLIYISNISFSQCMLGAVEGSSVHLERIEPSESNFLDRAVIAEVKQGLKVFELNSVDLYFNHANNAFAINEVGMKVIILGLRLYERFSSSYHDKAFSAYTGVIAHELAHAKQYHVGGLSSLENFQKELHADYLAGYYIGYLQKIELANQNDAEIYFDMFYSLGDKDFFSSDHHGTPAQRKNATVEGWKVGKELHSINSAYLRGIKYVESIENSGR